MKKIIPFLKPYRAQLLLAVLLSAASTLCELLLPTIMSDILDKGVYLADLSYILRWLFSTSRMIRNTAMMDTVLTTWKS